MQWTNPVVYVKDGTQVGEFFFPVCLFAFFFFYSPLSLSLGCQTQLSAATRVIFFSLRIFANMTHVLSRFPSGQTLCVQFHPHVHVDTVGRLHHMSAFPVYSLSAIGRLFASQPQLQSLVLKCLRESYQNIPILTVYQCVLTLVEEEETGMEDTLWGRLIYALVRPTRCGQSFARETPLSYIETVLLVVLVCAERGLPQRWQHELEDATLRDFWREATALLHQCASQPIAEAMVALTRFFGVPHAIQCVDKTCMAYVVLHSNRGSVDECAPSAHPRCYRALQSGVGGTSKGSSKRSYAELFDGEQSVSSSPASAAHGMMDSSASVAAAAAASSTPSTHNEKRFRRGDANGDGTPFLSAPSSFAALGVSGFPAAAAARAASSSASVSDDASSHAQNQSQLFDFSAYAWLNPSTAGSVAVPLDFNTAGQNNGAASLDASLTDEHLHELDELAETWSSHADDDEDDDSDDDDDDDDGEEESKHETPLRDAQVQHPGRHSGQSINTDFLRNMVRDALHKQGIYSDNGTTDDSGHHHQDTRGDESAQDLSSVAYQAGKPTWHAPPPRRNIHSVDIQPAHPVLPTMAPASSSKAAKRKTLLRMSNPFRNQNTTLMYLFQWHIQLLCQLLWIESIRHNGDSNARVTLCQMLHDCVALYGATEGENASECITVEPLADPRFRTMGAFFFPRALSLKLYPTDIDFCPPIMSALTGYPPLKHLITSAEAVAIRPDTASNARANVVTARSASPLAAWNITEVDFHVFWGPLLANPQYEMNPRFLRPFSLRPDRHKRTDSEKYLWHHYYSMLSDAQILETKDRFFPGRSLSELKLLFAPKRVTKRASKRNVVAAFPMSVSIAEPPVTVLRPLTFHEYWLCSQQLQSLKHAVASAQMAVAERKLLEKRRNNPWAYIQSAHLPHWNRKLLFKAWSKTLLPEYLAPVPTQLLVASPNVPSTKFISPALFPNELNRPRLQPFVFPPHVDQTARAQSIRKIDADLLLSIPISYHNRWHAQFRCGSSPHVILVYTFVLLATNTRVCYVHRSNLSALLDGSLSKSSAVPSRKAQVPTMTANAVSVHMSMTTALDARVMRIDRDKIRDILGEVSRRGASIDFFRTINAFPSHSFSMDVWIFLRGVLLPYLEYQEDMSHSHEEARNLSLVVGNAWR
jgi:hypothetical protein